MPALAPTDVSVTEFLEGVEQPGRRADAKVLCDLLQEVSGQPPRMWGPSIVGFGSYHYRYDSGREGNAPLAAFSPRKANMVVYLAPGFQERGFDLSALGKHKASKGCLYLGSLAAIDLGALAELVADSIKLTAERYQHGH